MQAGGTHEGLVPGQDSRLRPRYLSSVHPLLILDQIHGEGDSISSTDTARRVSPRSTAPTSRERKTLMRNRERNHSCRAIHGPVITTS